MNTIYLLKQIIDLLYEESKTTSKLTNDMITKLSVLERELEEKNKEIAKLYTENIKLENGMRQLENDIEVFVKVCPSEENVQKKEEKSSESSTTPVSNTTETTTEAAAGETERVQQEEGKGQKKDRRDYMREYQRAYRKKQREEKISMTV
jgi:phage-related minor tail protein